MLGGDLQGFPNGRRLTDDVVDISIQAVEGAAQTGQLVDALAAGDKVDANDNQFGGQFPYVALPNVGAVNGGQSSAAADPNAAPIVPPGDDDSPAPSLSPAAASASDDMGTGSVLTVAVLGTLLLALILGTWWFRRRRPRSGRHRNSLTGARGASLYPGRAPPLRKDLRSCVLTLRTVAVVAVATVALLGAGAVFGLRTPAPPVSAASAVAPDRLAASIARAQERLRTLPRDHETWAALGLAYVEQARVTADPSLYPKAEGALERSLAVKPLREPDRIGRAGRAGQRPPRVRRRRAGSPPTRCGSTPTTPRRTGCWPTRTPSSATPRRRRRAIQRMLDLRPGLAAYARASYDLEQRGEVAEAADLMRRALDAAVDPADIAFCRNQLGDLAWSTRRPRDRVGASTRPACPPTPAYLALLRGRARVAAARGDLAAAVTDVGTVAARTPTPDTLLEYATLLRLAGRSDEAARQLTLAEAAHTLFVANGGQDDLAGAQLALARGDAAAAVRLAQAEWKRRPFADVADVLGWSLHTAGRDAEALPLLRKAVAGSPRNAAYAYHLGITLLSLGDQPGALAALRQVRAVNPYFSPVDGPTAGRALAGLEARS